MLEEERRKLIQNREEEKEFRKLLSRILNGDMQLASSPLRIGITPNAIDCCIDNTGLDLIINKSVIDKCMRKEIRDDFGRQTKKSGHGLTEQQINDIIWAIKRPVMIIKGSRSDTLAVMTDLKDIEDRYIFAYVAINMIGATTNVNTILSAYGRDNIEQYLVKCIEQKAILAINKEKVDAVCLSIGGHFSEATAPINFDNTIAYSLESVKHIVD